MPMNKVRSIGALAAGAFNVRADSSRFVVVFDRGAYDLGAWSKVTGLGVSWDPVEYRTGANATIWSAPGPVKYTKLSLSRAVCVDSEAVQDWLEETRRDPKPFSGGIALLSPIMVPLMTWTLRSFYPVGWKIGDFDSKAATVVTETLDLAHSGFLEN